ncbi:MAG: alpha-glucosidase C-terminal domain-containing protein [Thermoflavifilum sp.]|nr:alpha-glucosidase C-terminal domain-containing protein [Thermoflavifilum sp.]
MRTFLSLVVIIAYATFVCSCHPSSSIQDQHSSVGVTNDTSTIDGHPAWIMQGNIYEVNVRQYTPEGTFQAFARSLPRLKAMGVQTLWFMPIYPISQKDRKGKLGSYYAVANYEAINPEFGNMQDWINLVKQCHQMGFKVIIDWVANHTGADHYWITAHPDFYVHDSAGNLVKPNGWDDVRQLNYANPALQDSMIQCMKFWVTHTDVDGFRCDYAVGPPASFWKRCIDSLRKIKNLFMLAEAETPVMDSIGFDATYAWEAFHIMKQIAKGERPASALDSVLMKTNETYPANALKLYFTSNHDENSWNGADYATMLGASHAPFAVLTQTLERSIPLIYSGQEEPVLDSISFFYKDPIPFGKYQRAAFYQTLLQLRAHNPALAANASFHKLKTNRDAAVFAFVRQAQAHRVVVLTNLTNKPQTFSVQDSLLNGQFKDVFSHQTLTLQPNSTFQLKPWQYRVLAY